MKIEKIVSDVGVIEILIDGKTEGCSLSRELTGTSSEAGNGIFNTSSITVFYFGNFSRRISFDSSLDHFLSVEEYSNRLVERIATVKKWVAECRASGGTVTIMEKEEVIEKLTEDKKLFYRNNKGQIKI